MNAALPAVFGAAALAMVGAFFGVVTARLVWADDLKQAERLKVHWDGSRKAMESTIESLNKIIEVQKRRLGE